jgi:hypothetical protein
MRVGSRAVKEAWEGQDPAKHKCDLTSSLTTYIIWVKNDALSKTL